MYESSRFLKNRFTFCGVNTNFGQQCAPPAYYHLTPIVSKGKHCSLIKYKYTVFQITASPSARSRQFWRRTFFKLFFNFMFMIWDSRQQDWQLFWLSFEHWIHRMQFDQIQIHHMQFDQIQICWSNTPYAVWSSANTLYAIWSNTNTPSAVWSNTNTPYAIWSNTNTPYAIWSNTNTPYLYLYMLIRIRIWPQPRPGELQPQS